MFRVQQQALHVQNAAPAMLRSLLLALLFIASSMPAAHAGRIVSHKAEDAAHQAWLASQTNINTINSSQAGKTVGESGKPLIELEALKDDPNDQPQDWRSKLGYQLDGVGISGFWKPLGLFNPLVQLTASILAPLLLLFTSMLLMRKLREKNVLGKPVKYVEEHHTIMMEDSEENKSPLINLKTSNKAHISERVEPSLHLSQQNSMQAAQAAARSKQPLSNQFANTNFAPSNSLGGPAGNSPADRAQMAALAAGAAAKAALNPNKEDYGSIPANFNTPGFIRKTRIYFIRLQIAWDKSDVQNISEITTPEICEEFHRQIISRGPTENITEVIAFEADVLGVKAVGTKFVVTVKITGIIKESESKTQQAFEEIWQMSRAITGKENWLVADIKQY